MRRFVFLILLPLCGCASEDTTTHLQRIIGNPATSTQSALDAFCKLNALPAREDPRVWIRLASNNELSLPARELAFHAFFRRFVRPPVEFGSMIEDYRMRDVLQHGTVINASSAETFPDELRHYIKGGRETGCYLWYPWTAEQIGGNTGEEDELGIWFLTSPMVTVEELARGVTSEGHPIQIVKILTLSCSQARALMQFYHATEMEN